MKAKQRVDNDSESPSRRHWHLVWQRRPKTQLPGMTTQALPLALSGSDRDMSESNLKDIPLAAAKHKDSAHCLGRSGIALLTDSERLPLALALAHILTAD